MLGEITDISSYLSRFGSLLAEKIQNQAEPLFMPGSKWDPKMGTLLRKPFQAQGDTIMGVIEVLKKEKSAMIRLDLWLP